MHLTCGSCSILFTRESLCVCVVFEKQAAWITQIKSGKKALFSFHNYTTTSTTQIRNETKAQKKWTPKNWKTCIEWNLCCGKSVMSGVSNAHNHSQWIMVRWELRNIIPHKHMQLRLLWFLFYVSLFGVRLFAISISFFHFHFIFFCSIPKQIEMLFLEDLVSPCAVYNEYHVRKIGCAITCYWFNGISVTMWMTS